jgi:hypothetical protein
MNGGEVDGWMIGMMIERERGRERSNSSKENKEKEVGFSPAGTRCGHRIGLYLSGFARGTARKLSRSHPAPYEPKSRAYELRHPLVGGVSMARLLDSIHPLPLGGGNVYISIRA